MIEEMVAAIVKAVHPEMIVLFGSTPRGEAGPDSDVDLLVVEPQSSFPGGSRWSECSRIRKALWTIPIPVDVIVVTPEEVEQWQDSTNHIIARCMREGKIVYERPGRRSKTAEAGTG